MGASALFVQAHDAKNSEILQHCQTPVRENRLPKTRLGLSVHNLAGFAVELVEPSNLLANQWLEKFAFKAPCAKPLAGE